MILTIGLLQEVIILPMILIKLILGVIILIILIVIVAVVISGNLSEQGDKASSVLDFF